MKVKIRQPFVVHLEKFKEGKKLPNKKIVSWEDDEILDVSEEEYKKYKHQLEPIKQGK